MNGHARAHEKLVHWGKAARVYAWLLEKSMNFPKQSSIPAKATCLLVDCLRVLTGAIELMKSQQLEESEIHALEIVRAVLLDTLRSADVGDLQTRFDIVDFQTRLTAFYNLQRRPWSWGFILKTPESDCTTTLSDATSCMEGDGDTIVHLTELHTAFGPKMGYRKTHLITKSKERDGAGERDILGWTSLHYATGATTQALEQLLSCEADIDINAQNICGQTPLHCACLHGNDNAVRAFLRRGAEINIQDADGVPSMHHVAMYGGEDTMQLLVEAGADESIADNMGNAPIHWAAYKGHAKLIRRLKPIANANMRDRNGKTPLYLIAIEEATEAARALLDGGGIDIKAKDRFGKTPLHWAAQGGREAIARLLAENGANTQRYTETDIRESLQLVIIGGHEAVVRLLVDSGASLAMKFGNNETPLHLAVEEGQQDIVRLLLEEGAKTVLTDWNAATPLILATLRGHKGIVRLLLEAGAK